MLELAPHLLDDEPAARATAWIVSEENSHGKRAADEHADEDDGHGDADAGR